MLVDLPLRTQDFPNEKSYRLNVFAIASQLGLDTTRLLAYRRAVKAHLYTDYPEEGIGHGEQPRTHA